MPVVSEADARALVRLLGQVAELSSNVDSKKRFLMEGLMKLIGADCWTWMHLYQIQPGEKPNVAGFLHGGFSEERLKTYLLANEHQDMGVVSAPFIADCQKIGKHTTQLRQQIDPEDHFSRTTCYPLWLEADIAPLIISGHPFEDGTISIIVICRRKDEPSFSERESRIVHILLSEVPWLYEGDLPVAQKTKVQSHSPRMSTVLALLLEGWARKEIANHLEISVHTVSGYIKELYSHYNVHSQKELMKYFQYGDGGDLKREN